VDQDIPRLGAISVLLTSTSRVAKTTRKSSAEPPLVGVRDALGRSRSGGLDGGLPMNRWIGDFVLQRRAQTPDTIGCNTAHIHGRRTRVPHARRPTCRFSTRAFLALGSRTVRLSPRGVFPIKRSISGTRSG